MKRKLHLFYFSVFLLLMLWLFVGYVMMPTGYDDDDYSPHFFIKIIPTFQLKFRDFYVDAGDIPTLSNMSREDFDVISSYCFHRYGFFIKNRADLGRCINYIHPDIDVENPNG